ncbi:hypothetical protein EV2_035582 [Malus domestica]
MGEMKKQFGQMEEFMGQIREQSELSNSTIVNSTGDFEIVEAITLRSGMEVAGDMKKSKHSLEVDKELLSKEENDDSTMASLEEALLQHPIISNPSVAITLSPPPSNSSKVVPNSIPSKLIPPNVPFPRRFMQSKKEDSEKDIFETFPKIQEKEMAMEYLELIKEDVLETTIAKEVGFYNMGQVTALTPNMAKCNIPKTFEVVFVLEFVSQHIGKPPPQMSISFSTNMLISMIQAPTLEFKPFLNHFKYHLPFKDQLHVAGPSED